MPNQKINDMTLAGAVIAGMQFETDIAGVTANKVNTAQLITFFNTNLSFAAVAHTHPLTDIDDITANRLVGSDGAGDVVEVSLGAGLTLVAGVLASSVTNQVKALQVYTDPADFTAGVTVTLPLPVDAVVEDNLEVYFNGLFQESTEWTITTGGSPSVDFSSAIPVGVTRVEVRVFS